MAQARKLGEVNGHAVYELAEPPASIKQCAHCLLKHPRQHAYAPYKVRVRRTAQNGRPGSWQYLCQACAAPYFDDAYTEVRRADGTAVLQLNMRKALNGERPLFPPTEAAR
jgi:hypothetical protein